MGNKSSREVIVAKNAGFCFGVRRAAEQLERSLTERAPGQRIVTLGHLIHNDIYNNRMAARGVEMVEVEGLAALVASATPEQPVLLIARAHGIPPQVEQSLDDFAAENPHFSWIDCTCPFVARIHRIVEENCTEAHQLWVFGKKNHPEVIGILGCFGGEKHVFDSAEDFVTAFEQKKVENFCVKIPIVVAQTTYSLPEWEKSQKVIKKLCTNAVIFDTICSVTEMRQKEAASLSAACDLMIVIGGVQSSNTAKLAAICRDQGTPTVFAESAADLMSTDPSAYQRIGIVAGASTPSDVIEEVYKTMSEMENFETLLAEENSVKTLNTGDVVTGIVEHVSDTEIQLDLGTSVTGYIKAEQVTDDSSVKMTDLYKKGDKIEAFVIRVSDVEGVAELSKKRVDSDKNWLSVVAACESGEIIEGKVIEAVKGGLVVLVNGANQVFVPASQSGVPRDGDMNAMVGQTVKLRVIEIRQPKKAIGSIRSVLREERRAKKAEFWANIEEGKVYTGAVRSMTSYGAFVDLGCGVDGMVHVTELSWKRIKSPADVLSVGDVITVFVKSFDREKEKISLGYKTEDTNPWNIFTSQYAEGDVVSVKIVSLMPFGAFAEIVDGVDGLIHISEIAKKRIGKPEEVLSVGQIVDVKIREIDMEKQKVGLSIRALLEDAVEEPAAEVVEEEAAVEEPAEETAEA
ncbi:MAG: 4-hydroxy-3-methylbut-2-enyl diphosphate reductase [Clostridia bacterium]|nr:4-hydroxy-3-methylbut-2-enyl diphosphate reductase [Clostridia bacterium]